MSFVIKYRTSNHELIRSVEDFISEWNNDNAYIQSFTSGSTGKPKVIRIKKEHMVNSAKMTGEHLHLSKGMRALLCLSPSTIAGKMMIVRSIVLELELTVTNVSSTPFAGLESPMDFTAMVPLQLEKSLDKIHLFKTIIIGGSPISEHLFNKVASMHTGCYQTFGMTETISHIAMKRIKEGVDVYELLPGVYGDVKNGCLVVTAVHLGIEELITNDIVEFTDATHFIWKGRADFVINSGGFKLHPEEIESKLGKLISTPFFVYGIEDSSLGQKLILCIEGSLPLTKDSMNAYLPKYAIPKEIYFFKSFHYTSSGKLDRMRTIEQLEHVEKQVL